MAGDGICQFVASLKKYSPQRHREHRENIINSNCAVGTTKDKPLRTLRLCGKKFFVFKR